MLGTSWRKYHLLSFFCYIESGEHLAHHHEYDQQRPHEVPDLTLGTPWSPPEGTWARICWALGMPINLLFYFTIPDVKKESCRKFVAFSFVVCIVWIGVTSYILVWMVTIIGYTFMIPDTVMGLSLVAFGSSVPDCLSSLFVAQKGKVVKESTYLCCKKYHCIFSLTTCLANWSNDEKENSDAIPEQSEGPKFGIRTAQIEQSRITLGEVIFEKVVVFMFWQALSLFFFTFTKNTRNTQCTMRGWV